MKCPICGQADLIHDVRDIPYTYKGETTIIPAVEADFCPACSESITSSEESRRIMAAMQAFQKEVNAQSTDPKHISAIRAKLNLTQQEAGALFGGGVNAFSRYETGKTKPPLALLQLFKILDKHPDLLRELA